MKNKSASKNTLITCLALALTPAAWSATETFATIGTTDLELPSGVSSLTIECRGGGGAGGSATRTAGTGSATSGGGAGGNYARTVLANPASGTYKVTVGGGGVSLTTVATNDSVAPGQQGGTSKFTDAAGTVPEIALATGGAGGRNARISTTTTVALLGGDGDTMDNRGDVIFSGGNGGDAGTSGGGGGGGAGDAADAPDVLVSLTGGAGGTLGGGNGSSGRGAGTLDNPASQGAAPGGGGGGVKIQANGTNRGGNGGAGTVKLTYTFASELEKFAVAAASPQIVGVAFDVTVTALNGSDAVVDIGSTVVSVSSPAGSLMEFDWNGDGTYGDNSGTLTAGTKTIKARNKKADTKTIVAGFSSASSLTPTPASVTTTAAAFAKLQILAPGETAVPGTDIGRTGTPTSQSAGVAFNVRVNAVDEFWNLVSSVTDTVAITSTDGVATLPADAPLVAGTKLFSVTLNTQGVFTLTATDVTDGAKTAHTTQDITITNPIVTWDAGNTGNGVTIDPADGTWNTTAGNIVWNNTGTNIVWDAAKQAIFAGADGTYAVTVGGSFDAQKIRFENSGYTLSSPSIARTITLTIPSGGLTVASGKSATIGTNVSVNGNSTYFIGAPTSSSNGGTLNIEGTGATVRPVNSGNSLLIQGIGTIVNVKTGGFLGLAPGIGNSGFTVGTGASSDVSLNVDGGTVNVQSTPSAAGSAFNVGGEGKATVTLSNSGAITVNPGKTNGVTFGSATSNVSTNTLNLDGGTLTTRTVRKGAATSTAIFNFNGGTLQANSSDSGSSFMTGLNQANVKSGGALIDTVAFNVTIGQNLLDGTGGGGLTKLGSGILTLTGANTYTGPTAVNVGTLALVGGSQTSAITLAATAKLSFTLGSPTTSTAAVTLTDGTVAITGAVNNVDSYKLMTAASFTGPFNLASPVPGYTLELQASGSELWLVSSGDPFLAWVGAGADTGFNQDANKDGVDNGLAWFLNADNPNDNANGLLPVPTQDAGALVLTFTCLDGASRGAAVFEVQYSSDLGQLDNWAGTAVPATTGTFTDGVVDFVVAAGPEAGTFSVTATIPVGEAVAGKVFGRIKGVN